MKMSDIADALKKSEKRWESVVEKKEGYGLLCEHHGYVNREVCPKC